MKLIFAAVFFFSAALSFSQEPSLGDVARASRARQSKSTAKVFSNEDQGPQEIKETDDPLEVYTRAAYGLMHDTSHRCQAESSGNSGPGWKKATTFEIAGPDHTRIVDQDGPNRVEWIMVGADSFIKKPGAAWEKLQSSTTGNARFPAAYTPQEMQFRFGPGELKFVAKDIAAGVPAVLYRFVVHSADFDRTVNYWIGIPDSLPRRIEMRSVTKAWGSAPLVWQESISCSYGVEIKIEPPM